MATLGPVYANSFMESRMTQLTCHRVPLPYLIRPRRILPPIDTFDFYNDYSDDDESDGEDSSMEAMETTCLNKGHLVNDEEEYVIVDHVEAVLNSKTEKAGAIQMMELSRDMVDDDESESEVAGSDSKDMVVDDASESEDAGSDSDDWVVV